MRAVNLNAKFPAPAPLPAHGPPVCRKAAKDETRLPERDCCLQNHTDHATEQASAKKRTFPYLLLLMALFTSLTCSPVPFNLALSESARLAARLTFVGQVGPLNLQTTNQGNEDVLFFPEENGAGGITLQAGFIYSIDPVNGQQVSFYANGGICGNPVALGPLSTDSYPNYVIQSVKSLHNVIFTNPSRGTGGGSNFVGDIIRQSLWLIWSLALIMSSGRVLVCATRHGGKQAASRTT